jgi:hypothetical protein
MHVQREPNYMYRVSVITQRIVVIPYRLSGQTIGSILKSEEYLYSRPLKLEPTGCPQTLVMNCHYLLRNNPEERNSDLLRGGSLKSRMNFSYFPSVFMIIRHFACSHYVNNCDKQARKFW